jgi:hypothetical protein
MYWTFLIVTDLHPSSTMTEVTRKVALPNATRHIRVWRTGVWSIKVWPIKAFADYALADYNLAFSRARRIPARSPVVTALS